MKDYWQENQFWVEPVLDLIQREVFVLDTPYRRLFARQFPRVTEAGVDYECIRIWKLGRSIIENGYYEISPIMVEKHGDRIVIRAGWHRTRVLRALDLPVPVEIQAFNIKEEYQWL